jgi:hypothetical protein
MLVIEYTRSSATAGWTAMARQCDAGDFRESGIAPVFEMLRGARPVTSIERRQFGYRRARAFVSPWAPPPDRGVETPILTGDPLPNVAGIPLPGDVIQTLWIDTESLLPLRWEVNKRGERIDGFDFSYARIDLRPPAGIDAPECIP